MRKSLIALVVVAFVPGCAGRDLTILCEVATEYSAKPGLEPSERAQLTAKTLDERLSRSGELRKTLSAVAMVEPAAKYALIKQSAKEMGHPEWECPALQAQLAPSTPAAGGTRCVPWEGASSLVVREQGGRGDFFREFYFDFGTGEVRLHDSDPFASGQEEKVPRVLKQEKTVEGAQREALVKSLLSICPSEEARKRECAPGGCSRLEVGGGSRIARVDDPETVTAVMKVFSPLFPGLRNR
ncbi:MAG TPA: hypothetical protein VGK67_13850 [Myxococcales bacterium]|jgi:hypothetical protein